MIEETKLNPGMEEEDPFAGHGSKKIAERESDYHKGRHRRRELSPERADAFAHLKNGQPSKHDVGSKRTYKDIAEDQNLAND